jgi:transcription initiation factor TFIIIB Brf1 subunit/transcription initiation factor TFIIB
MKKEYITNEAGKCPVCGGNNLRYDKAEFGGYEIDYPYVCEDCGCVGQECYKLEFLTQCVYDKEKDDLEEVRI